MYYKVTNKESEVYKALYQLRSKELQLEKDNLETVKKTVQYDWKEYLGYHGQTNFLRVSVYVGFKFLEPEKVDLSTWRLHKDHEGIYVPNKKTLKGRAINAVLQSIDGSSIFDLEEILNLDFSGKFKFPVLEIVEDVIILWLDDAHKPTDENIVEITQKQFENFSKIKSEVE